MCPNSPAILIALILPELISVQGAACKHAGSKKGKRVPYLVLSPFIPSFWTFGVFIPSDT